MEEALWDLEDTLKLSTQGAFVILASASFALAAICTLVILKRKARKNKIAHQEGDIVESETKTSPSEWFEPRCGWISVKSILMRSMRWCRASKWEEKVRSQRKLFGLEMHGPEIGRQSHNSMSAVWQRPILRGEKCELPRFSGLILYDEKGRLLRDSKEEISFLSEEQVMYLTLSRVLLSLL